MTWRMARLTAALGVALLAAGYAAPFRPAAQGGSTSLLSQLVWFDRSGKRLGTVGPVANHGGLELSPDGGQVAVAVLDTAKGARDLWIYNVTGNGRTRFTTTDADENWAIWSRDGRTIVFNRTRAGGGLDLFQAPATAGGMATPLLEDGMWPVSWAPDGRHILIVINAPRSGNDVFVLPLFGDRQPYPFAQTQAADNWAAFSPNGRWVAYSSSETGMSEVYVAPFPPTAAGLAGKQRVSADGGSQARWSRDGRELFYLTQDRSLMVTAVNGEGPAFQVGQVQRLFEPRFFFVDSHGFDVAPDGRILVNTLVVSPDAPSSIARN